MKIFTKFSLILILSMFYSKTFAATPNYSKDVAPIIYTKCTSCHRVGEIGPMPFTNYNEVKNYGQMIKFVTSSGYMPPWTPDHNYSSFLGERKLSKEEIKTIQSWVDNGMEQGDPNEEPQLPVYPDGSMLGTPDLTIKMSEKFLHKGNNKDQYQVFVLPVNIAEDKKIKAIEFRADNKKIVHHAILALDTTDKAFELDAEDPRYGYEQFGGFGFQTLENNWAGWTPGNIARFYPADIGKNLYKNSIILAQIHYAPVSNDEYDQSSINIFYDKDNIVERNLRTNPISPTNLKEQFIIPANEVKTFRGELNIPADVSLISVLPHMHLLGKSWEVFAVTPKKDTLRIIKIDNWDFNWQDNYYLKNIMKIPRNSKMYAIATYDNTVNNPYNPSSPPKDMAWGESTLEEMYLCYLTYVLYKQGDEKIDISTGIDINPVVYNNIINEIPFPNPTSNFLYIKLNEPINIQDLTTEIYNKYGQKVENYNLTANLEKKYSINDNTLQFDLRTIANGTYYLKIGIGNELKYIRFIKI